MCDSSNPPVRYTSYGTWTDNDCDGEKSIGDLICISTECFYIYSNDGTNIKALAQYNLYVGGTYNVDNATWTAYGDEATELQNSGMKGYVSGQTERYGTTVFSSDEVKGTNYSDYTGSIVEQYVNQYKTKLDGMNANIISTRLITKEELESLGCDSINLTCGSASKWVYSTSYWSKSAYDTDIVWIVDSYGNFDYNGYDIDYFFGVRPVIIIPTN